MSKFAHIADCHIGAQKHPKLQELEMTAFKTAFEKCMDEEVDFIVISGDLFHANLPDMKAVNEAVKIMKRVRDKSIPIYVIYGSHDFSPNETSIVDVLTSTGLLTKIVKGDVEDDKLRLTFTTDPKTGAKLVGMSARKRSLERRYYEILDRATLEDEDGFKIFAFHSCIDELKPEFLYQMESIPLSLLPKGFDYYAGGHVHRRLMEDLKEYGKVVFPGPLFAGYPRDLERSAKGESRGFFIVEFDDRIKDVRFIEIPLCEFVYFEYDASNKNVTLVQEELSDKLSELDVDGKIVILKVYGEMSGGKTSEINFTHLRSILVDNGAFYVSLNRYGLRSKEFEGIKIVGESTREIEEKLLRENIGNVDVAQKELKGHEGGRLALDLLGVLRQTQKINETKKDYNARVLQQAIEVLKLEGVIE